MKNKNNWNSYSYKLPNKILTLTEINKALIKFKNSVFLNLTADQYIYIIFKVKTDDIIIRSISTVQRVNKLTFMDLMQVFIEHWGLKSENYLSFNFEEIIFNYKIISKDSENSTTILNKVKPKKSNFVNLLKIGTYNFPTTMNIFDWGGVDFILGDKEQIVYRKYSNAVYHIKFINKTHKMVVEYRKENRIIVTFTDELLDINNLGTFKRTIKNQILYFKDGKLDYKEKIYIFPSIEKLKPKAFLINKFITMDLETYNDNGKLIPYAVSIYNGYKFNYFYLSDYENSTQMLITAIKSLLQRKYNGYKVYLHNFGNFDAIFLFDVLNQLSENIEIQRHNDKFIN